MTNVLSQFRPAIVMVIGLSLILGLLYPLAITGIAQVAFPGRADGSRRIASHGSPSRTQRLYVDLKSCR